MPEIIQFYKHFLGVYCVQCSVLATWEMYKCEKDSPIVSLGAHDLMGEMDTNINQSNARKNMSYVKEMLLAYIRWELSMNPALI